MFQKKSVYKQRIEELSREFSEIEVVNLLGQYIKNCIYALIYSTITFMYINNSDETHICSHDGLFFTRFVQMGSIIIGLIYLSALARYKTLQNKDYVVLYLMNIAFFLTIMSYLVYSIFFHHKECNTIIVFQKALLYLCVKKEFELALLIFTRSQLWIRQVNICSNCIFIIILFTGASQASCSPQACVINDFVNTIGVASFLTYTLMNGLVYNLDQQIQVNVLKITSILIIPMFIYAYVKVLYFEFSGEVPFSNHCIPTLFALDTYVYIIPIDIVCMITLQIAMARFLKSKSHFQVPENDTLLNQSKQNNGGFQQVRDLLDNHFDDKDYDFLPMDIKKS